MFGISGFELVIIVVFILVIFGPDKLPELTRTIGKAMRMFRQAQHDMERVIRAEMITGEKADLLSNPLAAPAPGEEAPAAETASTPGTATSAATVWAATAEDDEEEEDEE